MGKAEDAQKDGAEILEPTTDTVTYSDGMSEEVYGFDIPVPAIDEEFDVALIGTKGKWYDHKVSVKNPVKSDDTDAKKDDKENKDADSKADDTDKDAKDSKTSEGKTLADLNLEDGDYTMDVTLTGGSGRATIDSPAAIKVEAIKLQQLSYGAVRTMIICLWMVRNMSRLIKMETPLLKSLSAYLMQRWR